MVDGVPRVFRKTSPQSAVYDWKEVAQDNGMILLYGCADNTLSGAFLTSQTFYSDKIGTAVYCPTSDNTFIKCIDKDFDLKINKTITLKGEAVFEIPIANGINVDNKTNYTQAIAYLRKWDGTTETHLVSGASVVVTNARTTVNVYDHAKLVLVKVDVPTTIFKIGDTLRATIEVWGKAPVGSVVYPHLAHDPKNRDASGIWSGVSGFDSSDVSTLKLNIPVKIDL